MQAVEIGEGVYWVGALDWNGRNFHGYTTPRGTSYNAYLITGEQNVLIDAVKAPFLDQLVSRITSVMNPKDIDLIISNHVEMDHSSGLPAMQALTGARILASKRGVEGLKLHYETIEVEAVKDEGEIKAGARTLRFYETPFLHWPDSMFTYLVEDGVLFSMDAFGQHLCTSGRFDDDVDQSQLWQELSRYYANIVIPFGNQVLRAYGRIKDLKLNLVAPSHGVIWRKGFARAAEKYLYWAQGRTKEKVVIAYDTMWNSTKIMAETIAEAIAEGGVQADLYRISCTDRATIMEDILEARAVLIGTPTLHATIFPTVADFSTYMRGLRSKGKVGGAFGSYGWGGGAVKEVRERMEAGGIATEFGELEVRYVPKLADRDRCREWGKRVAQRVKEIGAPAPTEGGGKGGAASETAASRK
jgi:anaerobic nitric oxide reductase flavorubredoxin